MGLFNADFLKALSSPSRKLTSALAFGLKETGPTSLAMATGGPLPEMNEWNKHVMHNEELANKYLEMFDGWTRKQRDAKGYHSGMDVGMRYPNNIEDLRILGGLYQGLDGVKSLFNPSVKDALKNNFYDYRANMSGLDAAEKVKAKRTPAVEALMEEMAIRYADPTGDTTR